jgi:hypothetical protein
MKIINQIQNARHMTSDQHTIDDTHTCKKKGLNMQSFEI